MQKIAIIAHNIRSTYNVGAILRSCDGFGIDDIYFTGYTPYPKQSVDARLPHIADKLTAQIHKTALGAEVSVPGYYYEDPLVAIQKLRDANFTIVALEQAPDSIMLSDYQPPTKLALVLGEEVHGVHLALLAACDALLEIPMRGHKESFNVSVAAGIAMYALRTNAQ